MIPSRQYKLEEETKMAAKKDTSAAVPAGSDKKKALETAMQQIAHGHVLAAFLFVALANHGGPFAVKA